jgi:hypothetical protein
MFGALMIALTMTLLRSDDGRRFWKPCRNFLLGMTAICCCIWGLRNLDIAWGQSVFHVNESEDTADDTIYVWDAASWVNEYADTYMERGVLISEENLQHNLIAGAWVYHQVFFEEYLEAIGIDNPMYALVGNKNIYYVSEKSNPVYQYLCEHTGQAIRVEQVGYEFGIPVWDFQYDE